MTRIIVCSIALLLLIYFTRHLLNSAFDYLGFAGGAAFGIAFCAVIVALAFAFDARKRSPR